MRKSISVAIVSLLYILSSANPSIGDALAHIPVHPDSFRNGRIDQRMELGRIRFERYRQQKVAEIHQKSADFRLPSSPIGLFHPMRTEYSVLLIHGLNDSPFYMADLAELLHQYGLNIVTILLPGHGTDTREIRDITAEQWQGEVEKGLEIASLVGTKMIVGGFSLGGALAIDAALRHSEIEALLLFAPAIRLPFFDSLYNLTCLRALGGVSISAKMRVNPVKYNERMVNGICQVHRLLTNQLERVATPDRPKKPRNGPLYEVAARVDIPTFGAMTYADERVSPEAILKFFGELKAPAMLMTFGPAPDDQPARLANGADIVHISDHELPHSFLVRRTNQYNGQANPFFDAVAEKLLVFLRRNL